MTFKPVKAWGIKSKGGLKFIRLWLNRWNIFYTKTLNNKENLLTYMREEGIKEEIIPVIIYPRDIKKRLVERLEELKKQARKDFKWGSENQSHYEAFYNGQIDALTSAIKIVEEML